MNTTTAAMASAAPSDPLLTDKQLAELLNVSNAWVRKQRHLRRKGEPHTLAVDPVYVGEMPRYRTREINDWLATL